MGTHTFSCVRRTHCYLLGLSSCLVFSLWIYLWCVYIYLLFKNHLGSFPTLRLWVQSAAPCRIACKPFCWLFNYGNESNVCSASGFIVKSNNGNLHMCIVKKILLLACERRNSPRSSETCLSGGLQTHKLVAETSQVPIQVLRRQE